MGEYSPTMTARPNSSVAETTLALIAATPQAISFPLYGAERWALVVKNIGANPITACVTKKFVHSADTNPGPDTALDAKMLLAAGASVTVEAWEVCYEEIQFLLTSAAGTSITYSFLGRSDA